MLFNNRGLLEATNPSSVQPMSYAETMEISMNHRGRKTQNSDVSMEEIEEMIF